MDKYHARNLYLSIYNDNYVNDKYLKISSFLCKGIILLQQEYLKTGMFPLYIFLKFLPVNLNSSV